ncbi:MAG: hypothetical protein UU06_C0012G0037, partial [Parcubacteria group bacterium GW2011_GWB1_40_5]
FKKNKNLRIEEMCLLRDDAASDSELSLLKYSTTLSSIALGSRLEKYLQDNGVSQQEINAMDPKTAWQRAKEIRGGSPGPRGPAPQGAAQPLLDLCAYNNLMMAHVDVEPVAEEEILSIKTSLEQLPEIAPPVVYVTREEVLADFKNRHQNDEFTLQALDELGENPLGATLNIKAKDPSQYESIVSFFGLKGSECSSLESKFSIIDKVNYCQNKDAIDRLTNIINSANRLGFILTIFYTFKICMVYKYCTKIKDIKRNFIVMLNKLNYGFSSRHLYTDYIQHT